MDSHPRKGDRIATVTLNPTTKQLHRIKHSTYNTFMFLFLDKDGCVQQAGYNFRMAYDLKSIFRKVVGQLNLFQLSGTQQKNIRRQFLLTMIKEANYVYNLLPRMDQEPYQQWLNEALIHIQITPINEIHLFPDVPGVLAQG